MLHNGLIKLGAVLCLILQIWGGTGLDRTSICIRPVETPAAKTCGCCEKKAAEHPSTAKLTGHTSSGCCITAKLPEDPTVLPSGSDQGQDLSRLVATFASPMYQLAEFPALVAFDASPPSPAVPRVPLGIASTRLRL